MHFMAKIELSFQRLLKYVVKLVNLHRTVESVFRFTSRI
jgi:hypothetical protein